MHSPDYNCLKEFNKIAVEDIMRIRKFSHLDLDFVIDIGANIGIATIYAKILFPNAKIISLEPDPVSFKCLKKNTEFIKDICLEQKAFGDGGKCNINDRENTFLGKYTTESADGEIESLTLSEIFEKYDLSVKSKYFIKSDCEGAEKYFIGDPFSKNAIVESQLFFMEVHFKSKKTPMFDIEWNVYNDWLHDNFSKTHNVDYFISNRHRGYGHYLLSRKGI
jgi:FkbM family methyltransferase